MKILIKEEQQNKLKLSPFIYKAIVSKNTSIGDNPALPPYGDFGFEYSVVKSKFEEIDNVLNRYINNGELESKDPDYLISVLSEKIEKCKKIEKPIASSLEKICENIVNAYFSIPSDTVIFNCKLVGGVKPKKEIRILPEDNDETNGYDFEDVDEVEFVNKHILKRRFINALIQGISRALSISIDGWYDEINKLNGELWKLWGDIVNINEYLLFVKQEKIDEKKPKQLSYVEVNLGKRGKKTIINAQGQIFPYLLRESIRGFLELFSSHGLPKDVKKAMYIIRKSDFLVAEPWDLRLGMGIFDVLNNSLTNKYQVELFSATNKIPFFFSELCSLHTEEFNSVMKNFLLGTRKGRIIAKRFDSDITHDLEYQKFKDRVQQKNIKTSLISDGDFSKEELDDYVLQENEINEMMAYHGSSSDFDKFNHKKYLNTGAGSQCFGWGTYITDDKEVANGYSKNAKRTDGLYRMRDKIIEIIKNEFDEKDELKAKTKANYIVSMLGTNDDHNIDSLVNFLTNEIGGDIDNVNEIIKIVNLLRGIDFKDYAFIYEVDIPDDNGQNYVEWYEEFPSEFMKRILQGFLRLHDNYLNSMAEKNYPFKCDLYQDIIWMKQNPERADKMIDIISNGDYEDFFSSSYYTNKALTDGKSVYRRLQQIFFGSDKAASLFLMQCGFDGIKYPSGTKWQKPDGASEDAMNYVIFDANKVKIISKTMV